MIIKERSLLLRWTISSTYLIVGEAELLELCQPVQPSLVHRYHLKNNVAWSFSSHSNAEGNFQDTNVSPRSDQDKALRWNQDHRKRRPSGTWREEYDPTHVRKCIHFTDLWIVIQIVTYLRLFLFSLSTLTLLSPSKVRPGISTSRFLFSSSRRKLSKWMNTWEGHQL